MKKAVTILGIFVIIYTLIMSLLTNFAVGQLLVLLLGAVLALWFNVPNFKVVRFIKAMLFCIGAFFVLMIAFIAAAPIENEADFTEDAVIVLGCGVQGTVPTDSLVRRMDKAVEYYEKNPDVLIVVSGGQGPQEDISEAQAMFDYLGSKGVDENKIIMEDRSSSTNENFKFSKQILDERLGGDYKTVYITNRFHTYRAGRLGRLNGLDVYSFSASLNPLALLPSYMREVLAVIQLWAFGR